LLLAGEDPESIDDESVYGSYRRPQVVHDDVDNDYDIPEHIRWKLFLARTLIMLKNKEAHA